MRSTIKPEAKLATRGEEVQSVDRVMSGELQFSSIVFVQFEFHFCPVPVVVWGRLGRVCEVLFMIEGGAGESIYI